MAQAFYSGLAIGLGFALITTSIVVITLLRVLSGMADRLMCKNLGEYQALSTPPEPVVEVVESLGPISRWLPEDEPEEPDEELASKVESGYNEFVRNLE